MENEAKQVPAQRSLREEDGAPSTGASSAALRYPRNPFERKVSLQFEGCNEFVEAMAVNISATGMLIRSENPRPSGTVFDFESRSEDGLTLIEGRGEVVWEQNKTCTSGPRDMGIRFLELGENSRRYIQRLEEAKSAQAALSRHLEEGQNIQNALATDMSRLQARRVERPVTEAAEAHEREAEEDAARQELHAKLEWALGEASQVADELTERLTEELDTEAALRKRTEDHPGEEEPNSRTEPDDVLSTRQFRAEIVTEEATKGGLALESIIGQAQGAESALLQRLGSKTREPVELNSDRDEDAGDQALEKPLEEAKSAQAALSRQLEEEQNIQNALATDLSRLQAKLCESEANGNDLRKRLAESCDQQVWLSRQLEQVQETKKKLTQETLETQTRLTEVEAVRGELETELEEARLKIEQLAVELAAQIERAGAAAAKVERREATRLRPRHTFLSG